MPYELQGHGIDEDTLVLRSVELVSPVARSKSTTNYHRVQVGMRYKGQTDWIADWNQSKGRLSAGTPTEILSEDYLKRRIRKGYSPVVKVTKVGTPASLVGASVTIHLDRVGGRSGEIRPFLSTQAGLDNSVRSIVDQLNGSGVTTFSQVIQLTDETPTAADLIEVAQYEDSSASADTTTAASFEDGPVAITVTAPPGKTTYVSVLVQCEADTASGTGTLGLAIGDGTTDHNEIQTNLQTTSRIAVCRVDLSIEVDTTLTMRFYRAAGSATLQTSYNTITATAISI